MPTDKHQNDTYHGSRTKSWADRWSNPLEVNFDVEQLKKLISPWRKFANRKLRQKMTNSMYFNTICGKYPNLGRVIIGSDNADFHYYQQWRNERLCLANPENEKDLERFRKHGYYKLNNFLRRLSTREVALLEAKLVIWCTLNLLVYYQTRIRTVVGCEAFRIRKKAKRSEELFCHYLSIEMPEYESEVLTHIVNYFSHTSQWDFEDVVMFVFQKFSVLSTKHDIVVTKLISTIEQAQVEKRMEEALLISKNLSIVLDSIYPERYVFTPKLRKCFCTLLRIHLLNIIDVNNDLRTNSVFVKFRIQIQNCVRNFISKMKDDKGLITMMDIVAEIMLDIEVPGDERADLVEMIKQCAQGLRAYLYSECITPNVLDFLLTNLKSDIRSSVMFSQRIFHHVLDRRNNLQYFKEPIYHFKGRSRFVVNVVYHRNDIHFFKSFSQSFFNALYKCLNRFTEITSLVSSYTVICLVLVEMPDPTITINVIHVVIKTQNNVLKNADDFNILSTYHIHSVIASILSLICLIHEDEVFALSKYVREVVSFRNENSPHLLPPLKPDYHIATHHTRAYHRELYFLEEEVLYALKQCWLGRRRGL